MSELEFNAAGPLIGTIRPPSDKSLTHRALMFGSIADGKSKIEMPLLGEDCFSTLKCLCTMGLSIEGQRHDWVVTTPISDWLAPDGDLYCGNSGTTMRLLAGLIASRPIYARLTGDDSLTRRPMGRIAEPLRIMGATITGQTPPVEIQGTTLEGITYETPVASAQIKSAILLAGLRASSATTVIESHQSRDHTERMLRALEAPIYSESGSQNKVHLERAYTIPGFEFRVPGDISSAAFLMVAGALVKGSRVTLEEVGLNQSRTGILDVFEQVGVDFEIELRNAQLGEPNGNISVRATSTLKAFEIKGDLVPRLIDEIPVLAVLATQCEGTSTISDAGELRVKESDRIEVVADGLRRMGANVATTPDGMIIQGPTPLRGTTINASGDHRIAMAFAIAGLICEGTVSISGGESIQTSYPEFVNDLDSLMSG